MARLPARLDDLIAHVVDDDPEGTPLDHVTGAALAVEQLGEIADHLLGHFVDRARRSGASWAEIGTSIGVTKQAAQKRFVPRPNGGGMDASRFARFTDHARAVIVGAHELAAEQRNAEVRGAHVLVALVEASGTLAARAIVAGGVALDDVRAAAAAELGPAVDEVRGHVPFGSEAKKLLELTFRAALRMGQARVGTEHVLLGMLDDPTGGAGRVLTDRGITRSAAEAWIVGELDRIAREGDAG